MPSARLAFTPPLPSKTLAALGENPSPLSIYLTFPTTIQIRLTLQNILQSLNYSATPTTVSFLFSRGCPAGGAPSEFTQLGKLPSKQWDDVEAVVEFSVYPMHLKSPDGAKSYINHIYGSVEAAKEVSGVKVVQERLCAVLEGPLVNVLESLGRIWDYGANYTGKTEMGYPEGEGEGHLVVQGFMRVQRGGGGSCI